MKHWLFINLMELDKFNLITIELDKGEKIPQNLSSFDAVFCMGGQWTHGWNNNIHG